MSNRPESKMADLEKGFAKLGNLTTKERKICIETLIKMFRNVTSNPDEPKYRTLKLSNKRFVDEVWRHQGAQAIMIASGWLLLEDLVHLPDDVDVDGTLAVLIDNRDVKPDAGEWVEETKFMGKNHAQLREDLLKRKALEEKKKAMAELKKDMAERKEIAQRIVNEHRNDREKRRTDKPSIATPRGSGKTTKMSDVVANKGG